MNLIVDGIGQDADSHDLFFRYEGGARASVRRSSGMLLLHVDIPCLPFTKLTARE